ncbi:MAG: O-antigen ligase family protein [Bacteroidales bacterium]|nr:O-antigen ligase family protein [Bacteroidales bacterium]MCF8405166.1 O-antigen ligase family protein [Bacteroidales bacterium]
MANIFIRNENFVEILTKTLVISALIASAIGFYQYSIHATGKSEAELFTALYNVKGLMAHKNQHAIFLFLILPFIVYGIFYLQKFWKILSSISLLTVLVLIFLLQTRSVWIGTVLFIFTFLILSFIYLRKIPILKEAKKIKRIIVIISLLLISSTTYYVFQSPSTYKLVKYKFKSIYDLDSENNRGRIQIALATIEMIKDNPVFGVGAGNWKINCPVYYAQYQGSEYKNWRRPHNDFIWILAEKGFFGFVSYILVLLSLLYFGFKALHALTEKKHIFFLILIIAGFLGYLVISNFTFPYERISHQTLIAIFMAIILANYNYSQPHKKQTTNRPMIFKKFKLLIIIPLIFSLYYSILFYRSEVYSQRLMDAQKQKNYSQLFTYSELAFTYLTTIDQANNPYIFYRGSALFDINRYDEAIDSYLKSITYNPYHHMSLFNLAITYGRKREYQKAIPYLFKVIELFPFYKDALNNLAKCQFEIRNYEEAYKTLLKIKIKDDDQKLNELLNKTLAILDNKKLG